MGWGIIISINSRQSSSRSDNHAHPQEATRLARVTPPERPAGTGPQVVFRLGPKDLPHLPKRRGDRLERHRGPHHDRRVCSPAERRSRFFGAQSELRQCLNAAGVDVLIEASQDGVVQRAGNSYSST